MVLRKAPIAKPISNPLIKARLGLKSNHGAIMSMEIVYSEVDLEVKQKAGPPSPEDDGGPFVY